MVFSNWNETRVTVLFKWWHTDNVPEYILTLFAVIAMGMMYQGIRTAHVREVLKLKTQRRARNDTDLVDIDIDLTQPLTQEKLEKRKSTYFIAALGTASYGLGLLLMFIVSVFLFPT